MILFKELNFLSEKSKKDENVCKFVVSPLFKNFGITVGNSLRRVLLNSLPGTAVFAIEIKGVAHEFSTIPGVVEDVTQIIFNLRKLILKNKLDSSETIKLKIDKKGPGKVLAKDIECPSSIEILNKNEEIANLTDKGNLKMFLYVRSGIGYVTSEMNRINNKLFDSANGLIYVDSNYSSILNVSYEVENIKTQEDVFEKLILEVKTNGLYTPQQAVANAANILVSFFSKFADIEKNLKKVEFKKELVVKKKVEEEDNSESITDLELSVRSTNCLQRENIKTIRALTQKTLKELKSIKSLGSKSIDEILEKLNEKGFKLRDSIDD